MLKTKHARKIAIIAVILLIIAWLCHFPPFHISAIPYVGAACGLLRFLIYVGFCIAWGVSLSLTIINKRLRRHLKLMAACCILWLFLCTVRQELTFSGDIVNTFLLYACYIPILLLPTFGFFASLNARITERGRVSKAIYLSVSCFSIGLILFILTNPFHELFWIHTPAPYSHNIGYYIVIAWIAFLAAAAIFNILIRPEFPGKNKAVILPTIVLGAIIGYFIMFIFFPGFWRFVSNDWTGFTCLAAIGLMQACITSGLLASNSGYEKVFEAANDGAIITDDDWNICYTSAGAEILPKEILQKTETDAFEKDKKTLLKGRKLHPGHVVWREDISEISSILEELEQNRKELAAKNELEREKNRTELALSKVQEKNRLFDLLQAATAEQNKLLHDTLSQYFEETRALLAKASVLGAYIKRKGNLLFTGDGETVKASELQLCLKESLANVELLQASCHMDFALLDETEMPLEAALCLYDSFETAIEGVLPDVEAAFIRIMEDNNHFRATYSLVSSQDLSAILFPKGARVEKDNDTWIVSVSIPKGGDAK